MKLNNLKNLLTLISFVFLIYTYSTDGYGLGRDYYTILRLVVCATTLYVARITYKENKEQWAWLFGFIAVLFNPLIPINLEEEQWLTIDLITALFLLSSLFYLKVGEGENKWKDIVKNILSCMLSILSLALASFLLYGKYLIILSLILGIIIGIIDSL